VQPWVDPRDPGRWWIALAIDGCHNNSNRNASQGFACPKGGAEQLWSSPALFGPRAKWQLVSALGPDGIFMETNRTAISGGSASDVGLPQHTEFVTPDLFAPGSMPTAPSKSTGVFMTSVYGYEPCCDNVHFAPRWNYQEFLVGEQSKPGGRFEIDWARSGAVDHSAFTPSDHTGGGPGLNVTVNVQYSCCGKSAFTESGRRVLLHAGIQNGGSNPRENAFSLARDVFFDAKGLLRQAFVPELAALREGHHVAQRYTVRAGATLLVPPAGNQLEIRARRLDSTGPSASSWGVVVFGSADLKQGARIGFDARHFFVDRRASGLGRGGDPSANPWSKPAERDVRAGPLPRATAEQVCYARNPYLSLCPTMGGMGYSTDPVLLHAEQSVHVFIDRSVISAIASNETAITAWTHPVAGSVALGLFAEGGAADVELEVWTMGSIL
jgi:hypothetical protein